MGFKNDLLVYLVTEWSNASVCEAEYYTASEEIYN